MVVFFTREPDAAYGEEAAFAALGDAASAKQTAALARTTRAKLAVRRLNLLRRAPLTGRARSSLWGT
jgi:hypothetical protein